MTGTPHTSATTSIDTADTTNRRDKCTIERKTTQAPLPTETRQPSDGGIDERQTPQQHTTAQDASLIGIEQITEQDMPHTNTSNADITLRLGDEDKDDDTHAPTASTHEEDRPPPLYMHMMRNRRHKPENRATGTPVETMEDEQDQDSRTRGA